MPKTRLSTTNSVLLLAAIVLWLASAWYIWGYRQAGIKVSNLQTQVASTRRVLIGMQQGDDLQALQQRLAALGQALVKDAPYPQGDVSLNVADLIVQSAAKSGATLTGAGEVARDSTAAAGKYRAVRYQVTAQGTLAQLQEFLKLIEASSQDKSGAFYSLRTLQEDRLKLTNKGSGIWSYALDVVVYSQP